MVRFVLHLHHYYHHPSSNNHITWWCDCKSLLQRLAYHNHPVNPNRVLLAEHDIEYAIRASLPLVTNQFHPKHLHSHQADNTSIDTLPLNQRLNRIADDLAKTHNQSLPGPSHKTPIIALAACQINIQGRTVTRSIP